MADLLTVQNDSMVSIQSPVAPIVNPAGPPPSADALSVGNAAAQASGAATPGPAFLGITVYADPIKNALFIGLVGFLVWKYGRRYLNA